MRQVKAALAANRVRLRRNTPKGVDMSNSQPAQLTWENVNKHVDALLREYGGDYVYPNESDDTCYYVKDGSPSCFVGHILHRFGIPLEEISKNEGNGAITAIQHLVIHDYIGHVDQGVASFLLHVQEVQDNGTPWGEAVEEALGTL